MAFCLCFSQIEYPGIPYKSQLSSRNQVSEKLKTENSNPIDSVKNMKSSRFLLMLLIFMWHNENDVAAILLDSDNLSLKLDYVK